MATDEQKQRLLADVGADDTVFTDDELDVLFTRAEETYPSEGAAVVFAGAKVLAVRQLIARAAPRMVKYKAGESTEDPTPILHGLEVVLGYCEAELASELKSAQNGTLRWGRLTRSNPSRERELPNS